eukprot:364623-Chlamydomonas_euryale.AAC.4
MVHVLFLPLDACAANAYNCLHDRCMADAWQHCAAHPAISSFLPCTHPASVHTCMQARGGGGRGRTLCMPADGHSALEPHVESLQNRAAPARGCGTSNKHMHTHALAFAAETAEATAADAALWTRAAFGVESA